MKRNLETIGISILLFIVALCADGAPPGTLRTNLTLVWTYPASELSTNLTFKLYSTTNITQPMATWPVLAAVVGTNTAVTLPIDANQRWFTMTSSNFWGESSFSNVAEIPAPPRSVNLSIGP